jgi:DNA (cytosine-5)-methyltransferase 1
MKTIKVGSDFSGVGAFNQALTRLGIEYQEVYACDMDKYARQTFIHNYGEPKYYPLNVYDREIPSESLDIYMTSPPCQAFSMAGKRLGKDDKRGVLFFNSLEFIQVNKPRFFIFENVKGLLSDDGGKTFSEWVNMLGGKSVNGNPVIFAYDDSVPYHLYWKVLNAKQHGVPQNRERVFLIGIRDNQDNTFRWPVEEHLTKRLKDVLEDKVDDKYFLSEEMINSIMKSNYLDAKPMDFSRKDYIEENISKCIKVGGDVPCFMVKSNTSKGYEEATEGDSINFSVPNSETRRGRVGKGVAQTLDTGCNQAVMVAKVGRSEEGKKARKEFMKKGKDYTPFQAKDITFEPSDTMNCITTATTKDNLIQVGDYRTDKATEGVISYTRDSKGKVVSRHINQQANTIHTATGGGGNTDQFYIDGIKIRRLSPRECFRLMDFPDTFTWPVSDRQAYKQAGNSIVVGVLKKIIKNLPL